VDTSKIGFKVRPYQVTNASPNTIAFTEDMLAGKQGPNIADLTQTVDGSPIDTNGYYTVTNVVNWDKDMGNDGNFQAANGYPDTVLPGQPNADGSYNNDAEEVLTYIQFPAPGVYGMGVNSDDGFLVTCGTNPAVYPPAVILGEFNAGRGSADTLFSFGISQAGFYPFRLIWENGGSGANCEWFSVTEDGVKTLINDSTRTNALKAFQLIAGSSGGGTNQPPPTNAVQFTSIQRDATGQNVVIAWTGGTALQSAGEVTGPYTDVTPAPTSPATIPISGPRKFYRVRQ
jgi:hypothetical protein